MNLRHPRTTNEAFRHTAAYGAAIERPLVPLWKRVLRAIWSWL